MVLKMLLGILSFVDDVGFVSEEDMPLKLRLREFVLGFGSFEQDSFSPSNRLEKMSTTLLADEPSQLKNIRLE